MSEKKNYHTIRYGNKDAEIKFGHIHNDNNISAFMIRSGYNSLHYMSMDATGDVDQGRKNGTINRCPGSYSIKSGDDVADGTPAIYVEAVNGDIVLSALNGTIRIQAENIEMLASGPDNKNGNIVLESNERIDLKSKNIEIDSSSVCKMFSSGTLEVVGDGVLNIIGGIVEACDIASGKGLTSKSSSPLEIRERQLGF